MSGTKFIDRGKYKLLPGNGGLRMRNKAVLDTQNFEGNVQQMKRTLVLEFFGLA